MNIAAVPAANTASGSANNQAQTASALGEAGSKALAGFLVNVSDYYKEQRRQKLTDAYSAGLNGVDLSRKTKDDAAAGLYIDQVWAMYDAGKQDAKAAAERENEETMSNNVETAQHETVDNWENIGYPNNVTSGNDSNNNAAADEYVPDMGAVTSKPSTESGSSTSGDKSFINRQWDQDYNYIMDMMFLNGAASSHDREIQKAYQYLTNNENRDKKIPDDIMKTFEKFMKDVSDGKNNDDLKVHKALQYINNAENEGKISPDTVKAVMAKTTAHDLSTQTMRNDQIRRSQGIALGDADVDGFTYDELKNRNDLRLEVSADKRKGDLWCWAAVMSTIDRFYNGGKGINQVDLRAKVNPTDKKDTGFGARDCEDHVNFNLDKRIHEVPSYQTIEANMRAGQPIVLHTMKPGTDEPSHFIVITGCYVRNGVPYVIINENRNGQQYPIPWNKLGKSFTTYDRAQQVFGYYTTNKIS